MCRNEIIRYLKNSKINKNQINNICYCFCKDFTASQTAIKLDLSRQTINNYYKMLRNILLFKHEETIHYMKKTNFCKNSFQIRFLKYNSQIFYLVECNEENFVLDFNNTSFKEIKNFINLHLNKDKINNKKVNCAKIFYNKIENKFLISNIYKNNDKLEIFINTRLKKFRGVQKSNFLEHIIESLFKYNYPENFLHQLLIKELNFNTKTYSI